MSFFSEGSLKEIFCSLDFMLHYSVTSLFLKFKDNFSPHQDQTYSVPR